MSISVENNGLQTKARISPAQQLVCKLLHVGHHSTGKYSLLILKLRLCYALTKIFVSPAGIDAEIFFYEDSLFYTFFNGTDRTQFEITMKIEEDEEEIFGKLRASKSDVLSYKYFIRKAMITESPINLEEAATTYPEIMTTDQQLHMLRFMFKQFAIRRVGKKFHSRNLGQPCDIGKRI